MLSSPPHYSFLTSGADTVIVAPAPNTEPKPTAISYTVGYRQLKTALFDWNLLVLLLIVSRVDFL